MRAIAQLLFVAAVLAAAGGCESRQRAEPVAPAVAPAAVPVPAAAPVPAPPPAPQAAAAAEEPTEYKAAEEPVVAKVTTTAKPAAVEIPNSEPSEVFVDTEPPDPVYEEPTPTPGPAHLWTKGYWHWEGKKWKWHHGAWRKQPAGRFFTPAHYEIVNNRIVYVRPHWAPRLVARSYGGRVVVVRTPVRPRTYRPGVYWEVQPVLGHRVGTRPATFYRPAGAVTRPIVVPVAPPRPGVPPVVVGRPPLPGHPVAVPPPFPGRPGPGPGHPVAVPGRPPVPGHPVPPPPPGAGRPHAPPAPPPPPPHHMKQPPPPPPPPVHGKGPKPDKHDKRDKLDKRDKPDKHDKH